jgi:hypothetical protein
VRQHYGGRIGGDCGPENLARMRQQCIHQALRDHFQSNEFAPGIQHHHLKVFDLIFPVLFAKIIGDAGRIFTYENPTRNSFPPISALRPLKFRLDLHT